MEYWKGRVAVITGAGSGIGRALARELSRRGARLALSDIDLDRARATAADCGEARAYRLDVAERGAVKRHAADVIRDFGRADVIVNNAGVALAADVLEQSDEDIDWLLGINLRGVIAGTQAFLPHVVQTRGRVINISSVFGIIPVPSQSIYNAAKFGVRGYTEALAVEMDMAKTGVGVHCVHPGGIATRIAEDSRVAPGRDHRTVAEAFRRAARTSPEEAARAIVRGVEKGRRRILVGPDARLISVAERLLGSAFQRVIAAAAGRVVPPSSSAASRGAAPEAPAAGAAGAASRDP